jgi:hypothetical protein
LLQWEQQKQKGFKMKKVDEVRKVEKVHKAVNKKSKTDFNEVLKEQMKKDKKAQND